MPQHVAILREAGGLGDVVSTFPLAAALKGACPGARLTYFGPPYYERLIRLCPDVDHVVRVPRAIRRKRLRAASAKANPYLDGGPVPIHRYAAVADCWCPAPPYEHEQFKHPQELWRSRVFIFLHYNELWPGDGSGQPRIEHTSKQNAERRATQAYALGERRRPAGWRDEGGHWLTPRVQVPEREQGWVEGWLAAHGWARRPIVGIQAFTSTHRRHLPLGLAKGVADKLLGAGAGVLVFDSGGKDRCNGIPGRAVFGQPLDRLAAFAERCDLVITAETGMLHLSAAVDTPALAICGSTCGRTISEFYPLATIMQREAGDFEQPRGCLYPCWGHGERGRQTCERECAAIASFSVGEVFTEAVRLLETHRKPARRPRMERERQPQRATAANPFVGAATTGRRHTLTARDDGQALYEYYRDERGFDAAVKGDWQVRYAQMLDRVFALEAKRVLDVGAMMGAHTSALRDLGADAWGVELLEWCVANCPFPNIRGRLLCLDAADLWPLRDDAFDLVHASQVYEHLAEDRVPLALAEACRVLKPGGILFASFPAWPEHGDEPPPGDDCTHVTYRPFTWWREQVVAAGLDSNDLAIIEPLARLRDEPMQQTYHWGLLLASKPAGRPSCPISRDRKETGTTGQCPAVPAHAAPQGR